MSSETDRKSDMNECYNQAWTAWGSWQSHARDDIYAVVDNAWTKEDISYMRKVMPNREIMSFNQLRRYLRMLCNFEKIDRKSIKYTPVEDSDAVVASQYTLLANDAMARRRGYYIRSDCFDGAMKTGLNLFNISPDSQKVPHFERYAYNQFILHPSFSQRDLSDCQYGILRKPITPSEAKIFAPDAEDYIDHLLKLDKNEDEKFPNMPKLKLYGQYLLNLDEWTRRTTVRKRYFVSQGQYLRDQFGNKIEFTGEQQQIEFLQNQPMIDIMEEIERTVEITHYLNGEEIYHGIDPFGFGDFSFTPYFAYFDPEVDHFHLRIQSVIRGMKDSQRSFDRRTIASIRALEASINAGTDFEEDTLVDKDQAYTAGNGPRWLKEGAIAEGRYRDRPNAQIPPSWFQLQESFERLPGKILGINEDGMMGVDQKDQLLLGVVGKMRLGLSSVGMFDFFDAKAQSDQIVGLKLMKLLRQYSPEKVTRITGQQVYPLFYNKDFSEYDAVPGEMLLTDSQKDALFSQLLNMKIHAASLGEPLNISWGELLQIGTTALPQKLADSLRAKEEAMAMQQQRAQKVQDELQTAALQQLQVDTGNEQIHMQERIADLAETKVDIAQKVQDLGTQPKLDALDRYIELKKVEVQRESKRNTDR